MVVSSGHYTAENRRRNLEERISQMGISETKRELVKRMKERRSLPPRIFATSKGKDLASFCLGWVINREGVFSPYSRHIRKYHLTGIFRSGTFKNLEEAYTYFLDGLYKRPIEKVKRRILAEICYNDSSFMDSIHTGVPVFNYKKFLKVAKISDEDWKTVFEWAKKANLYYPSYPSPSKISSFPTRIFNRLRVSAHQNFPNSFHRPDYSPDEIRELFYSWISGKKRLPKHFFKFSMSQKLRIFFEESIKPKGVLFSQLFDIKVPVPKKLGSLIKNYFSSYQDFLDFIYPDLGFNNLEKKIYGGFKQRSLESEQIKGRRKAYSILELVLKKEKKLRLDLRLNRKYGLRNYCRVFFQNSMGRFNQMYEREHLHLNESQIKQRNLLFSVFGNVDYDIPNINFLDLLDKANLSSLERDVFEPFFLRKQPVKEISEAIGKNYSTTVKNISTTRKKLIKAFNLLFPEKISWGVDDDLLRDLTVRHYEDRFKEGKGPYSDFFQEDFQRKLRHLFDYLLEKEGLTKEDLYDLHLKEFFEKSKVYRLAKSYFQGSPSELLCFCYPELKKFRFKFSKNLRDCSQLLSLLEEVIFQEAKTRGAHIDNLEEKDLDYLLRNTPGNHNFGWSSLYKAYPGWKIKDFREFYAIMSGKVKLGSRKKRFTLLEMLTMEDLNVPTRLRKRITQKLYSYYCLTEDITIPPKIVHLNLPLIKFKLGDYRKLFQDPAFDFEEAESYIKSALIGALSRKTYDPSKSQFSTWTSFWIRAGISRYLNNMRTMKKRSGYMPIIISVNDPVHGKKDSLVEDEIEFEEEPGIDPILKEKLGSLIDYLPVRQRNILALRYGLIDGMEYTLQQIGDYMGVSRQRIKQIEETAINSLRDSFLIPRNN